MSIVKDKLKGMQGKQQHNRKFCLFC